MKFLVIVAILAAGCGGPERRARPPTPGRPHLTVMTYNVNFGIAGDPETIEVIRGGGADVVFLQETTEAWEATLAWRVVVETPLGAIQVLNLHLHPPLDEEGSVVRGYLASRRVRVDEVASYLEGLDGDLPTLIVGDFNEDRDGGALAYLRERGLRSALPELDPDADTWQWTTSVGTVREQLDHVVVDHSLIPIAAAVLPGGRSDHRAVVVTLEAVR